MGGGGRWAAAGGRSIARLADKMNSKKVVLSVEHALGGAWCTHLLMMKFR